MLQLNNITMQFGGRVLYKDVNIAFTPGECFGIIGANGAGKSTLLRIISGDLEPTDGHVSIDPKERLSVLKQDHNAFDEYDVLRTVLMGYPRLVEIMDKKDALYEIENNNFFDIKSHVNNSSNKSKNKNIEDSEEDSPNILYNFKVTFNKIQKGKITKSNKKEKEKGKSEFETNKNEKGK